MSIWNSRCTFPGWILCSWKTDQFGNECHTACCKFFGILFVVELVEGKAHTYQSCTLEFEDLDKNNVVLLFCMMKSYCGTGRYVIIDSGFCVFKGLI